MKKTILALTAALFIILAISSACSISHTQSIRGTLEISDDNQQATSLETITANSEKPQDSREANVSHNQTYNINDTKEAENTQDITLDNSSENPANANQDENAWIDTPPPDGRVYWTPEPPYAYTPTYTPKERTKIPIMPPESN